MAKLKNNQTDNIDFLNPYTFVPFQKVPPKPEAWEQKYSSPEDLLTGKRHHSHIHSGSQRLAHHAFCGTAH